MCRPLHTHNTGKLKETCHRWNHLWNVGNANDTITSEGERRRVALQFIHKTRLISMQTEIKRLSQVQYIIAFSSKNSLSEYSQVHPAPPPPLLPTTTNITLQFETGEQPLWRTKWHCYDNAEEVQLYWQNGADDVLNAPCVFECTLASPFHLTPPQPRYSLFEQAAVGAGKGWAGVVLSAWVWINKWWECWIFGTGLGRWSVPLRLFGPVNKAKKKCPRWLLIGSGEGIWWHCGDTLVCHNV